jgi:hypothetical protein
MPVARHVAAAAWTAGGLALLAALVALNPPLANAARHLVPLGIAFVVMLALCGLGLPLARWLAPGRDAILQWLAAAAIGMGLTSVLVQALGMAGSFPRGLFVAWYLVGLLSALDDLRRRKTHLPRIEPTAWNMLAIATLVLFTIPFLPFVVAPVASTDALQYHLLIPQIYLAQGGIARIPLLVQASYPALMEHVYLPVLRLFGDAPCGALHWWIAGLALLAIGRLSRAAWPEASPLLAPALFIAMPVAVIHAGWALNDLTFTLMVLVALIFLVEHDLAPVELRGARSLLAAGLMMGLASWTKYTFVLVLLALAPLLLIAWRRWGFSLRHLVAFAGGIWLVAPLWMIQNAVLMGNPVYPFLNGVFHSPYWPEASNHYFHEALRRFEIPEWTARTLLTWPFDIAVVPRVVDTHVGILPLLLAPLLLLRAPRSARLLRVYAGCFVAAWLVIHTETRSMLTLLAVILVVGCGHLQGDGFPSSLLRPLVKPIVGLSVVACFWIAMVTTQHLMSPFDWFIGRESRADYLRRTSESQEAYDWLNTHDDVRGALLVSLHGPYYLAKPCAFSGFADPPAAQVMLDGSASVDEMSRRLKDAGLTHVVMALERYPQQVRDGLWSWSPEQRTLFERFLAEGCEPVARFGEDVILRVR